LTRAVVPHGLPLAFLLIHFICKEDSDIVSHVQDIIQKFKKDIQDF